MINLVSRYGASDPYIGQYFPLLTACHFLLVVLSGSHAPKKPLFVGPHKARTKALWLELPHLKLCSSEPLTIAASVSEENCPE